MPAKIPWEADSETEMGYSRFIRACSWDQYMWKRREGSRIGQKEKSGYNKVSVETSANPMEILRLGWPIRSGKWLSAFPHLHSPLVQV